MSENCTIDQTKETRYRKCKILDDASSSMLQPLPNAKSSFQHDAPINSLNNQGAQFVPSFINKFDVNICAQPYTNLGTSQMQVAHRRSNPFQPDRPSNSSAPTRFPVPRLPSYQNRETLFLFMNPKESNSLAAYCFETFVNICCMVIDTVFITTLLCGDCRDTRKTTIWEWIEYMIQSKTDPFSVIEPDIE